MSTADDQNDDVYDQFIEMCYDLNMDKITSREAWNSYLQVKENYSLEGSERHWLACSLYVCCRKGSVPSVGGHQPPTPLQGNFISLTRLLRFSKFSLLDFFDKSKKWAEMCNLPLQFQSNLDALERNFAVSTFLFYNYFEPMFKSIYTDPADDPPRPPKPRKQRREACTSGELFHFSWTLFVLVKSTIPSCADLVSTYHLLLACVDYLQSVAVAAGRRDLFSGDSPALPPEIGGGDGEPPTEVPSILEFLCSQFDGLIVEAKAIRQHVWKDKIAQLFNNNVLLGDAITQRGLLDPEVFQINWKSVNKRYEEYLLTCGNFDERTFLGERAGQEIGTPSKANNYSVTAGDLAHRIQARRSLMLAEGTQSQSVLVPATPLTGRGYLRPAEAAPRTPITASVYSVSRLQALLEGRQPQPSARLAATLSSCSTDPTETIAGLVAALRTEFSAACGRFLEAELAESRFSQAAAFYYKLLESVLASEQRKKPDIDLLVLLDQAVFHRCLLACSLEIVLFSYSTASLEFPWLLEALNIEPYDFYKLLEIIIREEQGLCRDVVKHLNKVEELVLDSMAWRRSSRLWSVLEAAAGQIPTSGTVARHLQECSGGAGSGPASVLPSPARQSPAVRRVLVTYSRPSPRNPPQSPLSSATDRFPSPVAPSSARRRLFVGPRGSTISEGGGRRTYSLLMDPRPTAAATPEPGQPASPADDAGPSVKPLKQNSLGLFFRKFYYLASVRLRDLCERLKLLDDVRETIWTVFEFVVVNHVTLMQGRHLDQLLMSAIFVVCKAFGINKKFTDIMGMYRCQPQARSHVYRSVLLGTSPAGEQQQPADGGQQQSADGGKQQPADDKQQQPAEGEQQRQQQQPAPVSAAVKATPSRMCGSATSYQFEDRSEQRGDIIQFYNQVFVEKVKAFVSKFSKGDGKPPLSPLPAARLSPLPRSRKVSSKHSIYISPLKQSPSRYSEAGCTVRSYSFNRSPAHELRSINAMVKPATTYTRLRAALQPAEDQEPEPKRYKRRLRDVLDQRQASGGQ